MGQDQIWSQKISPDFLDPIGHSMVKEFRFVIKLAFILFSLVERLVKKFCTPFRLSQEVASISKINILYPVSAATMAHYHKKFHIR